MAVNEDLKTAILETAISIFNEKGIKFTMDDVAKQLSISKKTLYTIFKDKEALFCESIDYGFAAVKQCELEIYEDTSLSIIEKLRRIIIVLPDRYRSIDLRKLTSLKERYPKLYKEVAKRLESDWELTIRLLHQGMEEGVIRQVSIPVFKAIVEASFEHFLTSDILVDNMLTYEEALDQMIEIVLSGIIVHPQEDNCL